MFSGVSPGIKENNIRSTTTFYKTLIEETSKQCGKFNLSVLFYFCEFLLLLYRNIISHESYPFCEILAIELDKENG